MFPVKILGKEKLNEFIQDCSINPINPGLFWRSNPWERGGGGALCTVTQE